MSILSQFKQSQNTDFPNVRPSLDLRFALAKKLDPRITFTRGNPGTYFGPDGLMRTAGVNIPRFDHDPITGQSLGLLIEESRQNLLTYSEDFSNAIWNKTLSTISSNVTETTAPDGSNNADKLIITLAGTGGGYIIRDLSIVSGTTYTASCFVKAAEFSSFTLLFQSNAFGSNINARFNLASGTLGTIDAGATATIQAFPNGWYRCTATATATSTLSSGVQFRVSLRGNNTSGIYVWGAQVETGAFPTSYIPTSASTVTRSADNASMTGTNFSSWYNQSEGTFFTQAKSIATISGPTRRFLEVSNGGAGQRYLLGYSATSNTRFLVTFSGVNVVDITSTASPSSGVKMCASYSTNNFAQSTNGVLSTRDLQGTVPTVDRMILGWDNISTNAILCGTISRLTYYPIQLTNQQLINLSN
jgi:hypothetical protein